MRPPDSVPGQGRAEREGGDSGRGDTGAAEAGAGAGSLRAGAGPRGGREGAGEGQRLLPALHPRAEVPRGARLRAAQR